MNIGVVGNGFVGEAIRENLKSEYNIIAFDINPEKSDCQSVAELTEKCKFIFVSVPTPMFLDGSPDLSIIFSVMENIAQDYNDNIIILKSTVIPGTSRQIKRRFPELRIVFSPEFLTEVNSVNDFKNCTRMIFGGQKKDTRPSIRLIQKVFPQKQYVQTDWETAETVKYFINTFLATKVSFANEMKQLCDSTGTDYSNVVELALLDDRIGRSHLQVPGPDGYHGFGGKCFAKDLNALIHFCVSRKVKPTLLQAAWLKNLEVREEKDWLNIKGAVTKGDKK